MLETMLNPECRPQRITDVTPTDLEEIKAYRDSLREFIDSESLELNMKEYMRLVQESNDMTFILNINKEKNL